MFIFRSIVLLLVIGMLLRIIYGEINWLYMTICTGCILFGYFHNDSKGAVQW